MFFIKEKKLFSKEQSRQSEFAIQAVSEGKYEYFSEMYRVFALNGNRAQQVKAAQVLEEMLHSLTVKQLLWGNFFQIRDMWWYDAWSDIEISYKRFSHLSRSQYAALLKWGTFHANGYYRQRCMEALAAEYEDSLLFLILRLNDWVEIIREKAFELVCERLKKSDVEELFRAMPCFVKVQRSQRRKEKYLLYVDKQIKEEIAGKISQIEPQKVKYYEPSVRNAIYRTISSSKILEKETMQELMMAEKDSFGKRILIQGILRNYGCDDEQIKKYLEHKSTIVRQCALEYRYQKLHDAWQGIEELLLDKSKRIREYVSYILKKHRNFSILGFYLSRLETEINKTVPVLGIGEHGSCAEIEIIRPFLASPEEKTVKAALAALGQLAGKKEENTYWEYLLDERCTVAKQAYLVIKKLDIHYGAENLYEQYKGRLACMTGKYFLELLLREPSWERLPYLLKLYQMETGNMHGRICSGINNRSMYAKVSAAKAQEIRQILQDMGGKIPDSLMKGILLDLKYVSV